MCLRCSRPIGLTDTRSISRQSPVNSKIETKKKRRRGPVMLVFERVFGLSTWLGWVFGALVNPAAIDSFAAPGLVSSFRSIHIRVVFTVNWHFGGNLTGLRAGYSAIICSLRFYSQH